MTLSIILVCTDIVDGKVTSSGNGCRLRVYQMVWLWQRFVPAANHLDSSPRRPVLSCDLCFERI